MDIEKDFNDGCRFCGTAIGGILSVRIGGGYCCEGCFLRAKAGQAARYIRDDSYMAFAEALVSALDVREHETGLHSKRVACHTLVLAKRFTQDPERLRQIHWGALLHDIGKIGIPDAILLKEGPLTEDEWEQMRRHPEKGAGILDGLPFMAKAAEIVRSHEERYDGTGYPLGLRGETIPWGARLFAVIDTLDAMTSDRPYRKGCSFDIAKAEILRMSGTQFDPAAVDAFLAEETVIREMVALKCGDLHVNPSLFEGIG